MISKFYGKDFDLEHLRKLCSQDKEGVSFHNLSTAAEKIGFDTLQIEVDLQRHHADIPLPCVLFWQSNHYVVLYKIEISSSGNPKSFLIADPKIGIVKLKPDLFFLNWCINSDTHKGYILVLEPSERFLNHEPLKNRTSQTLHDYRFILSYFVKFRKYYFQLALGLFTASVISLVLPFLTQNIVDSGISKKDHKIIIVILLAQLSIVFGSAILDFIKRQLLIHISSRMNISIISDFLKKLMRLEIKFFENKHIGDIINRVQDQKRIENFISGSVLNISFVILNYCILSVVLALFNLTIFIIFQVGFIISFYWNSLYMKKRRTIDYQFFHAASHNNDTLQEIVGGMQEIKLNNFEAYKRTEWENSQIDLFKISLENVKLEQRHNIGSLLINQIKTVSITFISASLVIDGDLTLGMMLSISMIVGQLGNPIDEIINFIKLHQQAKISIERMNEVYNQPDEEDLHSAKLSDKIGNHGSNIFCQEFNGELIKISKSIEFENVSFGYLSSGDNLLFKNLSFSIPIGKTTAIVGKSGSGKTTLLKLILKFYDPISGEIKLSGNSIKSISASKWRSICGTVMQEGYIFNNSIARNIATSDVDINQEKLELAAKAACIYDFIVSLPNGFNTKIGRNGTGLSTGQKQRILISRSLYKNPSIVCFDEATSALDSENEHKIIQNLATFFAGKTVIVAAHRLSTVKNADQIIVLDNGNLVECGDHTTLVQKRSHYFNLIKNQLELDN